MAARPSWPPESPHRAPERPPRSRAPLPGSHPVSGRTPWAVAPSWAGGLLLASLAASAACVAPGQDGPPVHVVAEASLVEPSLALPEEVAGVRDAVSGPEELPPYEHQDPSTRDKIARMEGYFPDPVLVTQDERRLHFYEDLVRGKCVLIQFMYTTCTGT